MSMTKKQIDEQVKAIKRATKEACQSKESARQFLIDAGIIKKKKMKKQHDMH